MDETRATGTASGTIDFPTFFKLCWPAVFTTAAMLFSTNCQNIPEIEVDEATCFVNDGTQNTDNDADGDGEAGCGADDSSADSKAVTTSPPQSQPGGSLKVNAVASGTPSHATASTTHSSCYSATQATSVSANLLLGKVQFDVFCPGLTGISVIDLKLSFSKNGQPKQVVVDGTATLDCGGGPVVVTDFFNCSETIPSRHPCTGDDSFFPDIDTAVPFDDFLATLELTTENELSSLPEGSGIAETTAAASYFLSGFGLEQADCPGDALCASNADCMGVEDLCLDGECLMPSFGGDGDGSFSTSPDPAVSGQALDVAFTVEAHDNQLFPYRFEATTSEDAVSANGPLFPGLVAGVCTLGASHFNLVVLPSVDELLADLDGNGLAGAGEPIAVFGPDDSGQFKVVVSDLSFGGRRTVPADATLNCTLPAILIAGVDGVHPFHFEATSIDIDTAGEDDGTGIDPFVWMSDDFSIVIGDVQAPICGDADGSGSALVVAGSSLTSAGATPRGAQPSAVTATDALRVLRGAVGTAMCPACVCDVDDSGKVTASDALLVLKAAVGQPVTLTCPACEPG